jgi:2-amino-4-hydroxy-6-hydroxymethyldihydropteridine diphosphokinase
MEHEVIISIASNENQEANLAKARELLVTIIPKLTFTNELWTEPVNTTRKNMYLNQLCKGMTELGPNLLSEVLKETERRLGRRHNEDGIVVIDLDLLQYDEQRFHNKDWERSYVKDLIKEL